MNLGSPRLNLDLLKEILAVETYTYQDQPMIDAIERLIAGIADQTGAAITTRYDVYGNMYVVKGVPEPSNGYYPCVVAHSDTVHPIGRYLTVVEEAGKLSGVNRVKDTPIGIGGDDKVGVYICVEMLRYLDAVKVVIFRNEERYKGDDVRYQGKEGCQGSKNADMQFFADVSFVLQADRKGSSDFIDYSNGAELFSNEFYEAIRPILEKYGYARSHGVSTDVGQLKRNGLGVCCANVSCGYYNAHSEEEYVVVREVEQCLRLFHDLLITFANKQWLHPGADRQASIL